MFRAGRSLQLSKNICLQRTLQQGANSTKPSYIYKINNVTRQLLSDYCSWREWNDKKPPHNTDNRQWSVMLLFCLDCIAVFINPTTLTFRPIMLQSSEHLSSWEIYVRIRFMNVDYWWNNQYFYFYDSKAQSAFQWTGIESIKRKHQSTAKWLSVDEICENKRNR